MMNPNLKLATMFIIVALGTIGTTATAFAETQLETSEEDQARIEIADRAVHETFEPEEGEQVSDTDLAFHQGLCQVGITTEALEELGGCDALPPLVEIDE
ncbi:MAG TPA: hypothetical protein VFR94_06185 [Nitrososphaeraceae archaeon]|nr:hypothetical protein [Nitrososphaeraceae archaeon]